MRRRLLWWSAAITSLVVVAFVVPLGLTVRRQAEDRAIVATERRAESTAALVGLALPDTGLDAEALASALPPLPADVAVTLPNGDVVGTGDPPAGLVEQAASTGSARASRGDGYAVAVPVVAAGGVVVVTAAATGPELTAGVATAWAWLAAFGLAMIAASMAVAFRLGRRMVEPIDRLADAAHRLGSGDLDARVHIDDPEELADVGETFNWLAGRVEELIAAEREHVADLSHRLRTPLTAVRLEIEGLPPGEERESLLRQVDRLQAAVTEVIAEARRAASDRPPVASDLAEVTRRRIGFWSVLAEDQGRRLAADLPSTAVPVPVAATELESALDALIGNVFAHTPPETPLEVRVVASPPALVVSDSGPGFPAGMDPSVRGVSGSGSSGLGLDIARRAAERSGGSLIVGAGPAGGARVEMRFGGG